VSKNLRNAAIVVGIAAAVWLLPGAGTATAFLAGLLGIVFLGAIAFFVGRLYMEHRTTLFSLGDRMRAVLYFSVAVAVVTVTATGRLWDSGPGTLVWFVLIGAASYGVVTVWRHSREY
jgi:hypothetical protein